MAPRIHSFALERTFAPWKVAVKVRPVRARTGPVALMVFGTAMLVASAGLAAPPRQGVRLDPLQPASPNSIFFRAEGPHTFKDDVDVEFTMGLGFEYAKAPLRVVGVDASGTEEPLASLVDHAILARVAGAISPVSWLAFDINLPIALYVTGEPSPRAYGGTRPLAVSPQGLGDLRLGVHARPVDTGPIDLILGARFWAPLGSSEAYLSDNRPRAELDLGAAGELGDVLYGCTLSVALGLFVQRDGDRGAVSCAAHVAATPFLSLGVEPSVALVYNVLGNDTETAIDVIFEPLAAVRIQAGGFRVGLGAGPTVGSLPGAAEIRALLNLSYTGTGKAPPGRPRSNDRDLDEVLDAQDACPDEAGPRSDSKESNGCPTLDRDADGIRDADDYCADRPGVSSPDPSANGCPDSDNDNLLDPLDKCPNEPGAAPTGCPRYARLAGSSFKITPPIEFKDAALTPEGQAALEEIAATMRANPKLELLSISIGTKGVRASLSDARAERIILILRSGYLDSNRYEVVLSDDLRAGSVQVKLEK